MPDLILAADGQHRVFGPPRAGEDRAAWAYWHGWDGNLQDPPPEQPELFGILDLTLGVAPTRFVQQAHQWPTLAIRDPATGEYLFLGGFFRHPEGTWVLLDYWHWMGPLGSHHRPLACRVRFTTPLALRPDPARTAAWLAGAPALGVGTGPLHGLPPGDVPA